MRPVHLALVPSQAPTVVATIWRALFQLLSFVCDELIRIFCSENNERHRACKEEFDKLLESMNQGIARPCFAVDLVQGAEKKEFNIDETEKLFVFSTLLDAGSDTSSKAINQIVAAAAVYPKWVKTSRKHLDEVCGHNAKLLPSLADRDNISYITVDTKESLRWRPFI
jgi:cytochrome P450